MSDWISRDDAIEAFLPADGIHWVQLSKREIVTILRALPAVTVQAQIDAAVKAERERCAERFANHDFICMKHYAKGWRHDVYAAIRKGEQP
jgi:hypothetical protein